jgi:Zn-dependent protease with chaperone function
MARASHWWSTPVDPALWFSAEERAQSAAYHGPVHAAGTIRAIVRTLGLASVWLLADERPTWVIAAAVIVVWWLPGVAVEAWHEYTHEPRFGSEPLPPVVFSLSSIGVLAATTVAFGTVGWLVVSASRPEAQVGVGLVAFAVPFVGMIVGPRLSVAGHGGRPLGGSAASRFADLASQLGIDDVRFTQMREGIAGGPNAFTAGVGRRATICLSPDLLHSATIGLRSDDRAVVDGAVVDREMVDDSPPPPLVQHVVAHELAHVRRRHALWASLLGAVVFLVVGLSAVELAWRVGEGPERLPAVVLALVGGAAITQPVSSWISRAHERRADLDACRLVTTDLADVRAMYVAQRVLLAPSRPVRIVAAHPSPAERLELLRRAGAR